MQRIFQPSSLPNQAVNYVRKKNDKLARETTDILERIARTQLQENKKLNDYYKMYEGDLVWADYSTDDFSSLDGMINNLLSDPDIKVPSFVKHYDILGIFANQIVGEWLSNKDGVIVDTINDPITDNEFLRERSRRLSETVRQSFELEYKILMAEQGFTEQGEFQSEEEQQQYLQQLEALRAQIKSPEDIEKDMKSWKTQAVYWANAVITQDNRRFDIPKIERAEVTDFVLTGRYFRNYYIGYDYYKPERWDPRLVFFSRDFDAEDPSDLEYVGVQYKAPVHKIKERFGHILSSKDIQKIESHYGNGPNLQTDVDVGTDKGLKQALSGDNYQVPFYNYPEYKEAVDAQDLFGVPMGENIIQTDDGEVRVPYYLDDTFSTVRFGDPVVERSDFAIRRDTVLVTESYYKSMKKVWVATYKDSDGTQVTDIFSAELLPDFIKNNNLRVDKTKSLEEIQKDLEEDTIRPIFVPEVRKSLKINAGIGKLGEFYYDDVLPFQIRGNSDTFDVKIPVGGVISSNYIAKKIRPYQIAYNICLNQIMNMMEKELGLFFLFDVNLLPSEYKAYGDTDEALLKMREFIKDSSFAPIDMSKQNTQQNLSHANTFISQNLSYAADMQNRMTMAENYKRLAAEQIGINPQRLGTPSQYETAEGIRQGVQASYAQTESFFSILEQSRLKVMELQLSVAQYCQKEYIDTDFIYTADDGSKAFIHLSDPNFPLRRIGVLPMNDSNKRAQRDMLVQTLLNTNTMGADILDYAKVFTSKSTQEILEHGRQARAERLREAEMQRQHEQEIAQAQIQSQEAIKQAELENKNIQAELDRERDIEVARIRALGYTANSDTGAEARNEINRQTDLAIKDESLSHQVEKDNRALALKEQSELNKINAKQKELELKEREISQKESREITDRYIAGINKN